MFGFVIGISFNIGLKKLATLSGINREVREVDIVRGEEVPHGGIPSALLLG